MHQRPLPEDVTRTARAYLATLVPTGETSDAWHELLDDVAYWKETGLVPVLHLAHQVVLQHERVTPDVAALALTDMGITDPADVASVLDVDPATARDLVAHVSAAADDPPGPAPAGSGARPAAEPEPDPVPAATVEADGPVPSDLDVPPADEPTRPAARGTAVRIGFDDDPAHHDGPADVTGSWFTTRRLLVIAVALWTLILLIWALGGTR